MRGAARIGRNKRHSRAGDKLLNLQIAITMSDQVSQYLGKKYACPECQARLKFRRPPTKQLLTCPNCRRKLRLQDRATAPSQDELIREAIESLVSWKPPDKRPYVYSQDPRLDRVESPRRGVWKFDQPWPDNIKQVVVERTKVLFYPANVDGTDQSRRLLLDGSFRRVTVAHTRNVEEMEVTGNWWDYQPRESNLGVLARSVVRELNRIVTAKHFAARINCIRKGVHENREVLELFIDLAIQESPK